MRQSQILPDGRVLRYSFHERLTHWLAGVSYVYLLLTGLAFWSPWLFWLAVVLGGPTISRELHPWVGVVFMFALLVMFWMWASQMRETEQDKAFWAALPHYIRNEDELVPPADRFNAGQKLLFWGFFFCGILLLLSGLILWFPQQIPWNLRYLRYTAVLVHPAAALLTIGLFIIHVYMGTAMERGAFGSVIRGDVSRAWAKKFHRVWYERLLESEAAKK
jgi:formate dehydrogenase subunit gamma